MAAFTTMDLPSNDLFSYITFSCWDNCAGPTPKCLWACSPIPDVSEIKLLTRLVLKTEVTRDPASSHIDCNVYNLPELDACAVSYLFSGYAPKSRIGSRIYCLVFVVRSENRARYMRWCSILDPIIKQGIAEYKVKLHQDYKAHSSVKKGSIKGSIKGSQSSLSSYEHLKLMVTDLVQLVNRMYETHLDVDMIKLSETLFHRTKLKDRELLSEAISAMMLSFNCVVVVGSKRHKNQVDEWVKTLSLFMLGSHQSMCFTGTYANDIIPNAKVQGLIMDEDLIGTKGSFLMTLYTRCTYPLTIVNVSKNKVERTASYKLHQINGDEVKLDILQQIFSTIPPVEVNYDGLKKKLQERRKEVVKNEIISPLLKSLIDQTLLMGPVGRLDFIKQWMAYLHNRALALIDFLTVTCKDKELVERKKIMFFQLISDKADLELILSTAESLHLGIYDYVVDESLDSKPKGVTDAL